MIGFGCDTRICAGRRPATRLVAAVDIDDAAAFGFGDEFEQAIELLVLVMKVKGRQMQVGAEDVERDHAHAWRACHLGSGCSAPASGVVAAM